VASDYTKLPIVLINNFIWDLASGSVSGYPTISSAVWNISQYVYKPFFPVNENLAPDSSKMPYILYDYSFKMPNMNTFWPLQSETAMYTIVGDVPQIFYLKNFIYDTLKKYDTSAQEINKHIKDTTINFKCIHVDQQNFIVDERRIDSYKPKYLTSLLLTYDYTK